MDMYLRKACDHWRVIARADVVLHRTRLGARREGRAREHVVETPSDISLPHVAPRRPPGEHPVVVGIERAPDVDQPAGEKTLDERAFFGKLADRARLALLGV